MRVLFAVGQFELLPGFITLPILNTSLRQIWAFAELQISTDVTGAISNQAHDVFSFAYFPVIRGEHTDLSIAADSYVHGTALSFANQW
jgi:hypothetical protein